MGKAFFVATVAVGLHRLVAVPGRTVERACPWEHLPAPTPGGVHAFGLYTLFLGGAVKCWHLHCHQFGAIHGSQYTIVLASNEHRLLFEKKQ